MIACVSPASVNSEETLSTLLYANRARNIQNKPVKNVDPMTAQINGFKDRIRELEAQLMLTGALDKSGISGTSINGIKICPKGYIPVDEKQYHLLEDKLRYSE